MEKDKFMEIFSKIDPPDLGGYGEGCSGGSSIRKIEGQILYKICKVFQPKRIIETGTHSGCSTNYLLKYAEEDGSTVYSFDVVSSSGKGIIEEFKTNLILIKPGKKLWRRKVTNNDINKIRKRILEVSKEGVDLFFHDSDHRYENAKWEYESITRYMKKGSPVIIHDILNSDDRHQTNILFDEISCSWKHIFDTLNGLGLIVL